MRTFVKTHLAPNHLAIVKNLVQQLRGCYLPCIPLLHHALYHLHLGMRQSLHCILQKGYFTPLFISRLANRPRQLHLDCGMPQILGPLSIHLGEKCRLSGIATYCGRAWGRANTSTYRRQQCGYRLAKYPGSRADHPY